MKPTLRLIFLALIILIVGTVQAIDAQTVCDASINAGTSMTDAPEVSCDDPPICYSGEITDPYDEDYYFIDLVVGQKLTIDVDAEKIGSKLDSLLEVFDQDGNPVDSSFESPAEPVTAPLDDSSNATLPPPSVDPYLELNVDVGGRYYLVISAANPDDDDFNTGSYEFSLKCSDSPTPPGLPDPVKVGELLGTTFSDFGPASLLNVNQDDASGTLRFPFSFGKIADVEYSRLTEKLFLAIDGINGGSIIPFDPNTGVEGDAFNYDMCWFVALEEVEDTLYGVKYEEDDDGNEIFSLVKIDTASGQFEQVASFDWPVGSLAYHALDKAIYGTAAIAGKTHLIKIDPTSFETTDVGETSLGQVVGLDFSSNNILYGAERLGNLFKVGDLTLASPPEIIAPITVPTEVGTSIISGLTFVVGEASDVDPIKTLCSSTVTNTTTASPETNPSKLSKLKLRRNPLHRAIGLFKFQGKAGERVILRLAPEGEEPAVAEEETAISPVVQSWLNCRGKGRVLLGIRDAIPNVEFRARKKDQMPFDLSADLPEDGYYYIMVIRPLLRFYKTDYCLTLESQHPESVAWKTLDVVWPGDDSEEDTTTTSTEEKAVFEPVDTASDQVVQEVEETAVEPAPVEKTTAEVTEQPALMGAPQITEESIDEPVPAEETTVEVTEQPTVTDDLQITKETIDEPVPAEETTVEVTEQPTVTDDLQITKETIDEPVPVEETIAEVTEQQPMAMDAPQMTDEIAMDETGEATPEASAF